MKNQVFHRAAIIAALMFFLTTPSVTKASEPGQNDILPPSGLSNPLPLAEAVLRSIEANFQLKAEKMAIFQRQEDVAIGEAMFDPTLELGMGAEKRKTPTGVVLYENEYEKSERLGADAGIRKMFQGGLQARLGLETFRSENSFLADSLDPQYRTIMLLNLTQPILKGFGSDINTTQVRVSENRTRQALLAYANAAQTLAEQTELVYRGLSLAEAVLKYRIRARELARELTAANRERFDNGLVSITEVNEAETAVTDRDENVSHARQQVEMASNQLKDLMEIGPEHPLYDQVITTLPLPKPTISYPSEKKAIETALANRPDLRQMQITIDNQELMLAYLKNQELPRVDLVGSFGVNGLAGGDRPVNLFGLSRSSSFTGDYADSIESMAEDDGYQWSAGIRFEYPLGNRAARSEYIKGKYQKRSLEYRIKRLTGHIRIEVKNAYVASTRSFDRVKKADRFVMLAQKTLDQENERLREGLSTTFRILDYQANLVAANIRYVTALADFHKSVANLYRAMGTNLSRFDILLDTSWDSSGKIDHPGNETKGN